MADLFKKNDAAHMAAVKRVEDAQTQKGKKVGQVGGSIIGALLAAPGGPAAMAAGASAGGKIGSAGAGAMRGETEDMGELATMGAKKYLPKKWPWEDDDEDEE